MTLRNLRIEWERQEDLIDIAKKTLQQEQQKATLHTSLPEIYQKSDNIHASFLFQPSWKTVLTDLCHKLCSFASSSSGGWMDFAANLSLDKDLINSVKHGNVNIPKDKAYIVLKEFIKEDDATVDKIFRSLDKMMRYDIIDTISPLVIDLCDAATNNQNSSQDGGYSSEENNSRTIIKPVKCKDVVIRNSRNTVFSRDVLSHSFDLFDEALQKSQEPFSAYQAKEGEKISKKMHTNIVMLTFAEDGEAVAKVLASGLRNSFDKHQRSIGVVVLSENKFLIADDPCIKITACFNQVDFVIPIITKKYIDLVFPSTIENTNSRFPSPSLQPDEYFAPLIFRLMSTEYTQQHCLNSRFRSVIPSDQKQILLSNHPMMSIPFLSPWCLSQEAIETPRKALLLKKRR